MVAPDEGRASLPDVHPADRRVGGDRFTERVEIVESEGASGIEVSGADGSGGSAPVDLEFEAACTPTPLPPRPPALSSGHSHDVG